MRCLRQLELVTALLLQLLSACADDAITNLMSPIASYQYANYLSGESVANGGVISPFVSFQYPEDFNSPALTNGGIMSPIIGYQYLEWPGDGILHLLSSLRVSYYYQFLDAPQLTIVSTFRVPTTAESTPAVLFPPPSFSQLKTFAGGVFTTDAPPPNQDRITIVLTHGWKSNPDEWGKHFAELVFNKFMPTPEAQPNIVAWDWRDAAVSHVWLFGKCQPGKVIDRTPAEGRALGQALLRKLGTDYSQPVHFIGHSLGTIVNAYAANWLQGDVWSSEERSPTPCINAHFQMTLFDEAEIATDENCGDIWQVLSGDRDPFTSRTPFYHPLPTHFAWADNYISAFGLLHTEAPLNVILTRGFPTSAPNHSAWLDNLVAFHAYPYVWYDKTVETDLAVVGHRCSFERDGFANAPANKILIQGDNEWDLSEATAADIDSLKQRIDKYRNTLGATLHAENPVSISANGEVSGALLTTGPLTAVYNLFISLLTRRSSSPAPQPARSLFASADGNGSGGETQLPAYAWVPVSIPVDATLMSFDFKLQGSWERDSFAAAFNGTNVLMFAGRDIETNVLFSSGTFDVTAFAGQTNEFFIGIVGGTSTNAELIVQDIQFFSKAAPVLEARASAADVLLSWPLSAQEFNLQSSTNLAITATWTTLTNEPAIVDLQNTVTNLIFSGARFYRLMK